MGWLVAGLLLFLGIHSVAIFAPAWRERTMARLGEPAWKTLFSLGSIAGFVMLVHGYGLARRIEQISGDLLSVNQGTLYPLLLKLEQEGAITSEWGPSDNNRRARFYALTPAGRRHLAAERAKWERIAAAVNGVLQLAED